MRVRCQRASIFSLAAGLFAVLLPQTAAPSLCGAEPVDFNRDIRPILSDHCFQCHGPDAATRVSDLRLDQRDDLFKKLESGVHAVTPGNTESSELVRRIHSADPDEKMPPPDADRQLNTDQVKLLSQWVAEGAKWREHWSFTQPLRHAALHADHPWVRNAIDGFVLDKILAADLKPSPEANRRTLLRRLSLDLTGLPPTPDVLRDFLADDSPESYERALDALLRSPHYGERMALMWLDAARYADTSGYQNDGPRTMWRWRDWVIESLNDNKPFDAFTIEQLAGDLLDSPTLDQRIATGFNRNHRGNAEGGIIPEEYQVEYVVDRVEATSTVWLGLTMGCARCHDHKYDPILQKDFYGLFAFFNRVPESGRAIKEGNSPPYLVAPTRTQQQQRQQLRDEERQLEEEWRSIQPEFKKQFAKWQKQPNPSLAEWNVDEGLVYHTALDEIGIETGEEKPSVTFVPGRVGNGVQVMGEAMAVGDQGNFGYFDAFTLAAWVNPDKLTGTIISRMTPVYRGDGYYLHLEDGRIQVNLVKRWLDDSIRVESKVSIPAKTWSHVLVTYDGSRVANGIRIYVDGKVHEHKVLLDGLNQTFASTEPLRIGGGHRDFHGSIDELRVYDRAVNANEALWIAEPATVQEIFAMGNRSTRQESKLREYYGLLAATPDLRSLVRRRREKIAELAVFEANLPTVMVMQDQPGVRETFVLNRGQYDQPGERVDAATPKVLPPFPATLPRNRLGLARWLVDSKNPLTARVFVNRVWQMHFGEGLVRTPEDFGVQGARPTHAELLDWLAVEFMESGWDIKHLHKVIVMSATYRQSSAWSESAAHDLDNRLLSRGPRVRLQAEMIRDQALALGGLLTRRLGGPSVKPYQPAGLWQEIATVTEYEQATGSDLYRRSMYTYWKRTVPPPTMMAFDATSREACVVRRSRTNTPLQALALMNDVTFVEAARGMAQIVLAGKDQSPEGLVAGVFERATSRRPTQQETTVLRRAYTRLLAEFEDDPERARQWVEHGQLQLPVKHDVKRLAALSTVASLVLNLDEVITRE